MIAVVSLSFWSSFLLFHCFFLCVTPLVPRFPPARLLSCLVSVTYRLRVSPGAFFLFVLVSDSLHKGSLPFRSHPTLDQLYRQVIFAFTVICPPPSLFVPATTHHTLRSPALLDLFFRFSPTNRLNPLLPLFRDITLVAREVPTLFSLASK